MKLIVEKKTGASGIYFSVFLETADLGHLGRHSFDTEKEVQAFLSGYQVARHAAFCLVQELPCMETWK